VNRSLLLVLAVLKICVAQDAVTSLPVFKDVTQKAGIQFKQSYGDYDLSNIVEGTGSGAMFFDYDHDGYLDIYFVQGCWLSEVNDNRGRKLRGKLTNVLYHNDGDGTFTDVTAKAGVGDKGFGTGCSAADYDADGDLDLYVLNYGENVFYQNNGDGTFTDITAETGLGCERWSLSAPWFDADGDGDLDVYVANYLAYDSGKFRSFYAAAGYPGPLSYSGQPDALYRNNGDSTFTDISQEAGVFEPTGRAMSASVADINNDGHPDIYVPNDAMENYYFRNTGNGTFISEGLELGMAYGEGGQGVSSMGPSIGDVDRDGWLDIYVPDMGYGCLLMNQKEYFEDKTEPTGLALICGQYTGWGGLLLDYDNDGYLDVFVANGNAHHEYTEEDTIMRNTGTGSFVDVANQSGPYFRDKHVGRGTTYGDYDNDGDLDILVVNLNDHPILLQNECANKHHWLVVDARLAGSQSPALGARVTVTTGDLIQIHDVMPVTGFLSQADARCHFGVGRAAVIDTVEVRWPDRSTTRLEQVKVDQFLVVQKKAKEKT
jgi:enediyne biosynthesis protein E4